jgi:hypothetical protein
MNVSIIEKSAFSYCLSLSTVYFYGNKPTNIGLYAFSDIKQNAIGYYYQQYAESWKNTPNVDGLIMIQIDTPTTSTISTSTTTRPVTTTATIAAATTTSTIAAATTTRPVTTTATTTSTIAPATTTSTIAPATTTSTIAPATTTRPATTTAAATTTATTMAAATTTTRSANTTTVALTSTAAASTYTAAETTSTLSTTAAPIPTTVGLSSIVSYQEGIKKISDTEISIEINKLLLVDNNINEAIKKIIKNIYTDNIPKYEVVEVEDKLYVYIKTNSVELFSVKDKIKEVIFVFINNTDKAINNLLNINLSSFKTTNYINYILIVLIIISILVIIFLIHHSR